ncbi:MAG: bifunctional 4-hydroxy-3-methylbut-2-enyl diphosphate reductase/30S ribosomal protein S1 [Oscillospiraceae bacterium]|jgi:4-hydroxy-3-methylbut-2-enyl diphosphate reductase|nr:bifunctional 4-hydroxy-3-methylbut-2-enyl diphosphate reductase/30S ribosomal protein S1 [Oscillospiraceae bacterium]
MRIIQAKTAGFCYGVRRAVMIARANPGAYCLGSLVHNAAVVRELAEIGVKTVESVDRIPDGAAVIIRSHGESKEVFRQLRQKGCTVIDATCPNVERIHQIALEASGQDRTLVIFGDESHAEVIATQGWANKSVVCGNSERIPEYLCDLEVTAVSQTTANVAESKKFFENLKKCCTNAIFCDTICSATAGRQDEAARLAQKTDTIIVVGDRTSSNANKLAEICAGVNPNVQFVSDADELDLTKLPKDSDSREILIGITAGASVPDQLIEEVKKSMETKDTAINETVAAPAETVELNNTQASAAVSAEEIFDDLLNENFKTLRTGEKVSGIVTSVSPTEVTVDLGTKQSGYIPVSELSDSDLSPDEIVKVGDAIEAFVTRVNDVEGVIMLSKKRLDANKNWDGIESAVDTKDVLEGTVIEENKGGVVVLVKGCRVFVPASQSGLPRETPMTQLLKQKVKLRITEANKAKRRIVGSIRAVANELRKENAVKIWEEIEAGKVYQGTVKTLTSFGAFIDIGGVDGMAHISTLSWGRVKHPSDVIKEGDQIEVYVIDFDREKKKISLGYRKLDENPWLKFTEQFRESDIADVKVNKIASFGAFAEILPHVDGLIHISQIAPNRINSPRDVLKEGDEVRVRIIKIDYETQKISLSIRAADEPWEEDAAEDDDIPAAEPVTDTLAEESAAE